MRRRRACQSASRSSAPARIGLAARSSCRRCDARQLAHEGVAARGAMDPARPWAGGDVEKDSGKSSRRRRRRQAALPVAQLDCCVYGPRACTVQSTIRDHFPPHVHRRRLRRRGCARDGRRGCSGPHAPASGTPRRALDADAEAIFAAVAPVLLAGALAARTRPRAMPRLARNARRRSTPRSPGCRRRRRPSCRSSSRSSRCRRCASPSHGRPTPWPGAAPADVRHFLDRCRKSSLDAAARRLRRVASSHVRRVVRQSAKSWPAIGYPGPPPRCRMTDRRSSIRSPRDCAAAGT